MSQEWYYSRNGKQVGPLTLDQLVGLSRTGGLVATDLVWHTSAASWVPAGQCPELNSASSDPATTPVAMATPAPILGYQGPSIVTTARSLEMLRQTRPWVLFISILLFIVGCLTNAVFIVLYVVILLGLLVFGMTR